MLFWYSFLLLTTLVAILHSSDSKYYLTYLFCYRASILLLSLAPPLNVIEYLLLALTESMINDKISNSRKSQIFEKTKNLLNLKDIILRGFSFPPLNWSKHQFPLFSIVTLLFSSTLIGGGGRVLSSICFWIILLAS